MTDGTPEGTERISDIDPSRGASDLDNLTVVDDKLFFTANDFTTQKQLWKLDWFINPISQQCPSSENNISLPYLRKEV